MSVGQPATTPAVVQKFATTARERIRISGGADRREHVRALAQRVEVADKEVRIRGSKSDLIRTLAASGSVKPATSGVRGSVRSWRRGWDSNPRYAHTHNGFRDRPDRPLWHLSKRKRRRAYSHPPATPQPPHAASLDTANPPAVTTPTRARKPRRGAWPCLRARLPGRAAALTKRIGRTQRSRSYLCSQSSAPAESNTASRLMPS